jgi:hypothetical protein
MGIILRTICGVKHPIHALNLDMSTNAISWVRCLTYIGARNVIVIGMTKKFRGTLGLRSLRFQISCPEVMLWVLKTPIVSGHA